MFFILECGKPIRGNGNNEGQPKTTLMLPRLSLDEFY